MRKRNIVKMMLATLLTGVLAFGLAGCGSTQTKETATETETKTETEETTDQAQTDDKTEELQTIRLGVMTAYVDSWVAIVGQEKGIYEKYGIDLQRTDFAAGINTVDAVTTNQIDIGFTADFAGINRIGNTQDNTDIRYFAGISIGKNSQLYVNPEVITSKEDLKNARIITQLGTVWEYYNANALEYAGYDAKDYEIIAVDSGQDGLALCSKGDADAFFSSGENASRLESYGWKPLFSQEDIGAETYCLYMANNEYLNSNKELIGKFIQATQETMDYIKANIDDSATILNDKAGLDPEVFKNTVADITYDTKVDQNSFDALQKLADWTQANGYYEKPVTVANYLNTDALASVFPDKVSYEAK